MGAINKNGWNMLDSYTEGQTIYGRDGEISVISESIINNVQTFLYGKSGIGKTSLLQAGIFPKLREEHFFPVNIRVAFYNKQNLNEVIKRLVEEEAIKENPTVNKTALKIEPIDGSNVSNCSLFDYFSKVQFLDSYGYPFIPVLLFDQFEESINNEDCWQQTVDFLSGELYDLLDNSITSGAALPYTNYRIVISMREDYLYCIEDIIDRYSLNELRYNRFRVTALKDNQAENVIRLTCGEDGLERGKESIIVKTIIDYVKRNSSTRFSEINTALLSLVCSLLSASSSNGCIKYGELRNVNKLLNSFYDMTCAKLKIGEHTRKYLENNLLTKDGRRSSFDKDEALLSGKISQEQLDGLVDNRILRCVPVDAVSYRYEFIHDLFAKMVSKRKSEERQNRFKPSYDKISQSVSRQSFLKKIFIIVMSFLLVGLCLYGLFQLPGQIELDKSIVIDLFIWCGFYYSIPLFVRRVHDMGYSGWLLILFPVTFILMFIGSLQGHENSTLFSIIRGAGVVMLTVFIAICFIQESSRTPYISRYSKIYESIYKNVSISNIEFIKSLLVEFICLFLIVISTSIIKALLSFDAISFETIFQKYKYPWQTVGFSRTIIASAFFIFFSPALKARISRIGYPVYLSLVPILNIFLLLEGLFPDLILQKIGLKKSTSTRNLRKEDDDVLIELNEELILPKLDSSQKKAIMLVTKVFFAIIACMLVPCVSFYFSYKKNSYARSLLTFLGLYPVLSLITMAFAMDNVVFYIIAGIYLIVWIHSAIYAYSSVNNDIIKILTSSVNMTNMDVSQKSGLSYHSVNRRIARLQMKGVLNKTMNQGGDIVWKAHDKH